MLNRKRLFWEGVGGVYIGILAGTYQFGSLVHTNPRSALRTEDQDLGQLPRPAFMNDGTQEDPGGPFLINFVPLELSNSPMCSCLWS